MRLKRWCGRKHSPLGTSHQEPSFLPAPSEVAVSQTVFMSSSGSAFRISLLRVTRLPGLEHYGNFQR